MTATTAGKELKWRLEDIARELGKYPHTPMRNPVAANKATAPGKNNQRKLVSPVDPNFIVYMLPGKLAEYGPPVCPVSGKSLVLAP